MNKIKEARKLAGLTQKAMSDSLKIPKRTIEDWEANRHIPPLYVEYLVIKELERMASEKNN